jgi:hypothetical protein
MGAAAVLATGMTEMTAAPAQGGGVPDDAFAQALQALTTALPGGAMADVPSAPEAPVSTPTPAAAALVTATVTPKALPANTSLTDATDDAPAEDDSGDAATLLGLPFLLLSPPPATVPALPEAPPGLLQRSDQAVPIPSTAGQPPVAVTLDATATEPPADPLLTLLTLPEEAAPAGDASPLPTEAAPPTPAPQRSLDLPPLRLAPEAPAASAPPPAESSAPPPQPVTIVESRHGAEADTEPAETPSTSTPVRVQDAAPSARPTPAADAAPAPAPDAPVAVERVISRRVSADGSLHEVVLRLDPPELGTVHVRVAAQAGGEVTTQITTTQPAALELLHQRLPELRAALNMAGLAVGDCTVSLNMTADGQPQQQPPSPQPQPAPRLPYQAVAAPEIPAPVVTAGARSRGRVDSFA